jgi:enoyl-CoA hydratase/carnithine racemase
VEALVDSLVWVHGPRHSDRAGSRDLDLNVVVFDTANGDFYLARYDTDHDPARTAALGVGPTGMHALLDLLVRLSRAPVVSIASIRGRARGAGGEFILACDLRFVSRENALVGQPEVGLSVVPGGGPMARLSRLVGRGRALEILLVADDLDGPRAELYGYVNRVIADEQLDNEVEAIGFRLTRFNRDAMARTKSYVDQVTLPPESEFPPALADFFEVLTRPTVQAQNARLEALGLNTDSDLERHLGQRVVESLSDV